MLVGRAVVIPWVNMLLHYRRLLIGSAYGPWYITASILEVLEYTETLAKALEQFAEVDRTVRQLFFSRLN